MGQDSAREQLLERFRHALKQPVPERYFDEDELVELFDYAGDLADDYVQMEVLFCGARLYPESTALAERRALFYLDTTIDDSGAPSPAAASYLEDNPEFSSPIFDIARLETKHPENAVEALDYILNQYNTFNDEEIIRLVDLAFDLDQYAWVKANMDTLRKKVQYQPVLVFEVMREADENFDNEFTITLAEEMIEIEPFAVSYWITLFRAQVKADRPDDAKSTFDYAKALGADDIPALMSLAEIIYNAAPYLYTEAVEMLNGLISDNPDEFMFVDCKCAILIRSGASEQAVETLKEFLNFHPGDPLAIRQLVTCNVRGIEKYVDAFYNTVKDAGIEPEIPIDLLTSLSLGGCSNSIIAIMNHAPEISSMDPNELGMWIEALYDKQQYEKIVELVDNYPHMDLLQQALLKGVSVSYCYIVSLMKLNQGDKAEKFIHNQRPFMEEALCNTPMPVRMSVRCLITLYDKIRRHPASDRLYWDAFEMLNYGKFR